MENKTENQESGSDVENGSLFVRGRDPFTMIHYIEGGSQKDVPAMAGYPCIMFEANGILKVFQNGSEEITYWSMKVKEAHIAGDGLGGIFYASSMKKGSYMLFSVLTNHIEIRIDSPERVYIRSSDYFSGDVKV